MLSWTKQDENSPWPLIDFPNHIFAVVLEFLCYLTKPICASGRHNVYANAGKDYFIVEEKINDITFCHYLLIARMIEWIYDAVVIIIIIWVPCDYMTKIQLAEI